MAERSVKLRKDQTMRRYVGVDVTRAIDTVAFGHMWNAFFGWRNLVWDLDKDTTDNQLRLDKAHPKLPIRRLVRTKDATTYADACVMPEGIDGAGTTATFTGADLNANDDFMHTFFLRPSADAATSSLNDAGTGNVADVLYVSSHGLHAGDMFGASGLAESAWLFQLSVAAGNGGQFSGPGWVVLSNCGTLDDPAHEDWLKVMSGPTPLRGVVGFQEVCPAEEGSVDLAAVFIAHLARDESFIEAWKTAVSTKVSKTAWIVLCHEEAKDDKIADWNASALKTVSPSSKILRFDDAHPTGVQVVAKADPFEAFWSKGATRITATNMFVAANHLNAGDTVTITVRPTAPATNFTAGTAIAITVVYIRVDYPQVVDVSKLFKVTGQAGISAPTTSRTNTQNKNSSTEPDTWNATVTGTPAEITLTLQCVDFSSLHEGGVPLRLQVNNGSSTFLFVRNGSVLQR
jgi:hypothetical protein